MTENFEKILKFLHLAERLKNELRNGCTSLNRKESVAEHTWRVALLAILCSPYLDQKINTEKALKIAIIHDLVEIVTGDVPYFSYKYDLAKTSLVNANEIAAIELIKEMLPDDLGNEIYALWHEFDKASSYEAKFVKAIDKMEAQLQFNEMDFIHWKNDDRKYALSGLDEYCKFDSFLTNLKNEIQVESKIKINNFDQIRPNIE